MAAVFHVAHVEVVEKEEEVVEKEEEVVEVVEFDLV